ncbi:MAG: flagellar protein FliT [Burkholderiaceae bacterium]
MHNTLIDYYRALESASASMLDAAKADDWDGVVRLEGTCAVLIEQLRFASNSQELPAAQRAEKTGIMRRILANDADIRYLAEPWMTHFEKKFDGLQQMLH